MTKEMSSLGIRKVKPLKKLNALVLCLIFLLCPVVSVQGSEIFTVPYRQENTRTVELKNGDIVTGFLNVSREDYTYYRDINFYVTNPDGNTILRYDRTQTVNFTFTATLTGTYVMHFDNSYEYNYDKTVELDYTVKSPEKPATLPDIFYIILAVIVIGVVIVITVVLLLRRRKTNPKP
jgi:hypothetical protein